MSNVFHDQTRLEILNANRDAFKQIVHVGHAYLEAGNVGLAATCLAHASSQIQHCGMFSCDGLEELMISIGTAVFTDCLSKPVSQSTRLRVWHVTTAVEDVGGHTEAIYRWIKNDQSREYSLLLTSQTKAIPIYLRDAVEDSGGVIVTCNHSGLQDPVDAAREIFSVLDCNADMVVLQLYNGDVSGVLPFCRPGGPSVLTYNTADHKACLGMRVSDRVIDIRESGQACTRSLRGCDRTQILPLLISDVGKAPQSLRASSRKELGFSDTDICILTIGSAYKYDPVGNLSFASAAEAILRGSSDTNILVVGPDKNTNEQWRRLCESTEGRVQTYGRQEDLTRFYAAADIYIEGFPFGSLTALLDARERGLPCVLAPDPVIPPYASDSFGIDDLVKPCSVDEYIKFVCELSSRRNMSEIQTSGQQLMKRHHVELWRNRLEEVLSHLPDEHSIYQMTHATSPPGFLFEFWPKKLVPRNDEAATRNLWVSLVRLRNNYKTERQAALLSKTIEDSISSILSNISERDLQRLAIAEVLRTVEQLTSMKRSSVSAVTFARMVLRHPSLALRYLRPSSFTSAGSLV